MGEIIAPEAPNYTLFTRAAETIQLLLDTPSFWESSSQFAQTQGIRDANARVVDEWDQCANFDPWEFELDFWQNLAEHPSLSSPDGVVN